MEYFILFLFLARYRTFCQDLFHASIVNRRRTFVRLSVNQSVRLHAYSKKKKLDVHAYSQKMLSTASKFYKVILRGF